MNMYFLHQMKHNKSSNTWDKGIVVKDTMDGVRQSYHAYLGAYAYGNQSDTDYVQVEVTDMGGNRLLFEVWNGVVEPEPEPIPEPEEANEMASGSVLRYIDFAPDVGNAGFHNSIYRGKYLGDNVTAAPYAAIDAGTFDDMYIGDYWIIDGATWRIAAFYYWFNYGDTACIKHHIVIVPDTHLVSCQMNSSNITTGAYIGSNYYTGNNSNTGRAEAQSIINSAFGSAHILSHREHLQNATTSGYESGGVWYDSTFELMTERMVYGCDIFHNVQHGSNTPNLYSIDSAQLPLFQHDHSIICNRVSWWLRDVVDSWAFASVSYSGSVSTTYASNSCGVRPAFGLVG